MMMMITHQIIRIRRIFFSHYYYYYYHYCIQIFNCAFSYIELVLYYQCYFGRKMLIIIIIMHGHMMIDECEISNIWFESIYAALLLLSSLTIKSISYFEIKRIFYCRIWFIFVYDMPKDDKIWSTLRYLNYPTNWLNDDDIYSTQMDGWPWQLRKKDIKK